MLEVACYSISWMSANSGCAAATAINIGQCDMRKQQQQTHAGLPL